MSDKKTRDDLKQRFIDNPSWFILPGIGKVGVGGDAKAGDQIITEVEDYDELFSYCSISGLKFFKEDIIDARVERLKSEHKKKVGEIMTAKKKEIEAADGDESKLTKIGAKYEKLLKKSEEELRSNIKGNG